MSAGWYGGRGRGLPRRPAIASPELRRDRAGFGSASAHIRGRVLRPPSDPMVTLSGYVHYRWEVVNTRTGTVLIRSDAFGLVDAIDACSSATYAARGAWFYGLRKSALS